MKIAICDDVEKELKKTYKICQQTIDECGISCDIECYLDSVQLWNHLEGIDLLILDVEMPYMDGLEIKDRLQHVENETKIIFVTNHQEVIYSAFGIHVFAFIRKQDVDLELPRILQSAIKISQQYMVLDNGVDTREIQYIKANHVYCKLYLKDNSIQVLRVSMQELEEKLEKVGYIKTHKSYLVNLKYAKQIQEKKIQIGEAWVPISARMKGKVKEQYLQFCEKNGRYC